MVKEPFSVMFYSNKHKTDMDIISTTQWYIDLNEEVPHKKKKQCRQREANQLFGPRKAQRSQLIGDPKA